MEKFEYKIVTISTLTLKKEKWVVEMESELNALGIQGWELVSSTDMKRATTLTGGAEFVKLIFKRKI
ncbi:MAG: DUF4177 domain-containing protein [Oscillospiraceae bacterium]|nr:DUF4177 domain-containing protein [Oscillospiraceae bacterium]